MKRKELQLVLAFAVLIILTFVMPFVAVIIYVVIYMTKSWKELLK